VIRQAIAVFHAKDKPPQPELWIATHQLARPANCAFYSAVNHTLNSAPLAWPRRSAGSAPAASAAINCIHATKAAYSNEKQASVL
jgi:hypothetical protein